MVKEFTKSFTVQVKKLLLGSMLILMALIISACADDGNGSGGGGETTPIMPSIAVWDGETITEVIPVNNVYEISHPNQLAWIVDLSYTADYDNFTNKTIKFTDNIRMDNHWIKGIKSFAGRLEGNNKTIHNINIGSELTDNMGLIRVFADGGYIDNLTIASGSVKGQKHVGSFVGQVEKSAKVTIKGVTNHATVEGKNIVGGLVGWNDTKSTLTIDKSSNRGNVSNNGNKTVGLAGGLVGSNEEKSILTIDNSSNTGNVKAIGDNVGGLIGSSRADKTILTNSHSYAQSVTGGKFVAGIVGFSLSTLTANNVHWLYDSVAAGKGGVEKAAGIDKSFTDDSVYNSLNIEKFADKNATATNFIDWDFTKVWEILDGGLYPTLCVDNSSTGGEVPVPPVSEISPEFYLGDDFAVASLDGKVFIKDDEKRLSYYIESISSVDKIDATKTKDRDLIITELKAKIEETLSKKISDKNIKIGEYSAKGKIVSDSSLTLTIRATLTNIDNPTVTHTENYIFTIGFDEELVKWDGKTETEVFPTDKNVYEIYTPSEFVWVAKQPAEINDLLAGTAVRFMKSVDMGNNPFGGIQKFNGRLEGNHKKIYGLKIDKASENNVGLISQLGNGGSIDNLTIASGSVKGLSSVGSFVGQVGNGATVTIKGVTNHAIVDGSTVGGLIGNSDHGSVLTIGNSSNTSNVSGRGDMGGLIGLSYSDFIEIVDSSNTGNIKCASAGHCSAAGGLIGKIGKKNIVAGDPTIRISNTYSYAEKIEVEGKEEDKVIGGIIGHTDHSAHIRNTFWLYDATVSPVGVTNGIVAGVTVDPDLIDYFRRTIAQFADKSNTATNFKGWDFTTVWEILDGAKYPTLRKPVATP